MSTHSENQESALLTAEALAGIQHSAASWKAIDADTPLAVTDRAALLGHLSAREAQIKEVLLSKLAPVNTPIPGVPPSADDKYNIAHNALINSVATAIGISLETEKP